MNSKAQDDLVHIKSMMERSSRFISLSGLSGIVAGTIALIGAYIAYIMLQNSGGSLYQLDNNAQQSLIIEFIVLAVIVLIVAISSGIYFTINKANRLGLNVWTNTSKNVLEALLIPLITGGVFCIALLFNNNFAFIAPAMLIFYGLALLNASKYTWLDIKYLGICELVLGLISCFVLYYGLLFWALGFGILHILYGIILYKKYN